MQAVEYYLTHDHITFSTDPQVSVYATNPQFKKICEAVSSNDWVYVYGLLAIVKQEQRLNKSRHGFSIHSDEVLFNGRSVNYLTRLAILHSIHDKETQPAALFQMHAAMEELIKFLEAPIDGQVSDETQGEIYRDLEESTVEEMLATLHTDEDLEDGGHSWGDSWSANDYPLEEGLPSLDGGSFVEQLNNSVEPGTYAETNINNDLEDLREEYLRNKQDDANDQK